jgi:hypothetical protein
MHRLAAEMRAKAVGADEKGSNLLWRTVGTVLEPTMKRARYGFDQSYMREALKGKAALAVWIENQIRPVVCTKNSIRVYWVTESPAGAAQPGMADLLA